MGLLVGKMRILGVSIRFLEKHSLFSGTALRTKNAQGGTKGLGPRFTFWGLEIAAIWLEKSGLPGLVNVNKKRTGKIHHFEWENPLYMAIFNSDGCLPEGNNSLTSRLASK